MRLTYHLVRLGAPVAFQLRVHWRGAATLLVLGGLTLGLLLPSRSLGGPGADGTPALALPEVPAAGPVLEWTGTARSPSQTQAKSLGELLSLLSGLAWIGFGVAAVSIFAVSAGAARERALDTGIRRAAGASLRGVIASLIFETGVLAVLALVGGVAIGGALLALGRAWWPGGAAAVSLADPAAALAMAAVLGAAALSSLYLVRPQDLLHPPSLEVGLGVPTYQVGISVALLLGAAALLGGSSGSPVETRDTASASIYRLDAGDSTMPERAERYGALLSRLAGQPGLTEASLTSSGMALGLGTSGEVTTDCGLCYFGLILIKWPGFTALVHSVSTDTFRAQRIPVLEGRSFEPGDRHGAKRVAIVNRHLAQRYYQDGHAVGRDIFLAAGWPKTPYTVIGVVDDERSPAIGGAIQPRETVYLSVLQHPPRHAELMLNGPGSTVPPAAASLAVRRIGTGAEHWRPQQRAARWIGGALAVTAVGVLGLALMGTLATAKRWADSMSWELALHLAVGARRRQVAWRIVRRTMSIGLFGGLLGLFFYAVVVAPALAGALPALPLSRPGLLARAAVLPVLLALAAAIVPGLRGLGRPPSHVLQ